MTNRELLESAARAAGYQICEPFRDGEFRVCGPDRLSFAWSPLEDDGDALRLAVKLRKQLGTEIAVCFGIGCFAKWESDPYAATRRAIVLAAAAIGEKVK